MGSGLRVHAGEHKTLIINPFFMVTKRYNSYGAVSQVIAKVFSFASKIHKLDYLKLSKN